MDRREIMKKIIIIVSIAIAAIDVGDFGAYNALDAIIGTSDTVEASPIVKSLPLRRRNSRPRRRSEGGHISGPRAGSRRGMDSLAYPVL
jgi:hypothetical protein